MTRDGACPCGAVRFRIRGPVRDVIVCHCDACREVNGGAPWGASAARRSDLTVEDEGAVRWERAAVSAHDASRGLCRSCGSYVFWDAPGRETVSFAAAALGEDGHDLDVAAHIWLGDQQGLEQPAAVAWHETPETG